MWFSKFHQRSVEKDPELHLLEKQALINPSCQSTDLPRTRVLCASICLVKRTCLSVCGKLLLTLAPRICKPLHSLGPELMGDDSLMLSVVTTVVHIVTYTGRYPSSHDFRDSWEFHIHQFGIVVSTMLFI